MEVAMNICGYVIVIVDRDERTLGAIDKSFSICG